MGLIIEEQLQSVEVNNMMILIPEKVSFQISSTDLEVVYRERDSLKVKLSIQDLDGVINRKYKELVFIFKHVADVRCVSLNFFEFNYDDFSIEGEVSNLIDSWSESGYNPDPYFYQVSNSHLLKDRSKLYDPSNSYNLKHYLIVGNDSYIEIVASGYTY